MRLHPIELSLWRHQQQLLLERDSPDSLSPLSLLLSPRTEQQQQQQHGILSRPHPQHWQQHQGVGGRALLQQQQLLLQQQQQETV